MTGVEIFSIIKDISLAGAVATTAFVAYTDLEKWQKELRGKANFEVARELIKSIYKLRDEISYCRSPFIAAQEFPENYIGVIVKHTNEGKGQAYAHVYSKRIEIYIENEYSGGENFKADQAFGKKIKEGI